MKGSRESVRAAGYVRVSDESQVDGHSLDAQRREIKRYCEAQGYELVVIYADEGVSAYTDQIEARPQFAKLLKDAEEPVSEVKHEAEFRRSYLLCYRLHPHGDVSQLYIW